MKTKILQTQKRSNYKLGEIVKIINSPYEGIDYTDGIIVDFEGGLANIICMTNGSNYKLAFYDNELQKIIS